MLINNLFALLTPFFCFVWPYTCLLCFIRNQFMNQKLLNKYLFDLFM